MRNFEQPGRSIAVGRSGMAATSHPMATMTAIDILKSGGKAIDAAVAACAVQCVVEAGSTGIGGDCFALLAPNGGDQVIAYNGSGRTPAAVDLKWFKDQGISEIARSSPHAVTVPGAVDAWTRLVADHGRMSMADILAPAIALAHDGYGITPRVSADISHQRAMLALDPSTRRIFLDNDEVPAVGSIQRQPQLAQTLSAIGSHGRDAFYRGDVAEDMVSYLRSLGGLHTIEDFASAAGEYVTPISATYRGWTVHECPPNGQGIIALMILKILERFAPSGDPLDPDNLYVEVEATRLAYAARERWLADAAFSNVPADFLLSDELADRLASSINLKEAGNVTGVVEGVEHSDTVYISVVDKDRNAVSFINSVFHPYGSGLMAPKSGVLFHNRGQSFVLKEGHPNAIAPRKRPMHTIIPGMVTRNGKATLSFGVMGGHYQAMGHAHFLSKLFDFGMDIQSAVDLPRLFPLPGTLTIEAEETIRTAIGENLKGRGLKVVPPKSAIGGAQAIWIDQEHGTLLGASDHRKDGCALGY
ncbi:MULTISPECIES: gamma-glutamyltransferase [unclassified Rhizobium]|uniref:gamma-glutamyltransferase n=1 Tax=unclassified Rhizobium TaxID=2613769 RepID=UPI001052B0DE|nr:MULTISPECIES: gamma-glutamyltransferase [unclassified Rhizobium]MBB4172159.1 gamma-glutamyltranspeptidase/glutathione hydrolase [Rhizobium sp. BK538]TCM77085.1 gamma-glutamyltranspeptidase/glutathione hydrolase [Rhizobium sp. BK068]